MTIQQITLSLPEALYTRLEQAALAMQQPLTDVVLRAVENGSPPTWEDVPAEFQADVAALDKLDDQALWRVLRRRPDDSARYDELLDKNANGKLSILEREELTSLRVEAERQMIRKAQSAALLRWRGYQLPPVEQLA